MTDPTVIPEGEQPSAPPAEPQRKSMAQIAKEVFGNDYHGEVEPPKKPVPVVEGDEVTPEVEEPPSEEPTEGEEPDGGGESSPEESVDERPIETLSELVEHLEADPEWANTLKVPVKVDGRQSEVPLSDLVASYQKQEMADKYLQEAREAKNSTTRELAEKSTALENQFRVAAELIKAGEATLERDIKAIDPRLRDEDPAEWAARRAEFDQRRQDIQRIKDGCVTSFTQAKQAQINEAESFKNQVLDAEREKLVMALPEWQDTTLADTERAEIADHLIRSGFTPEELQHLIDHRQLILARKAMLYDKSRGQVDAAKKRVVKVPKMMKPGAPKTKDQLTSERLEQLRLKSVNSGTIEDATAYRLAKRGVSR